MAIGLAAVRKAIVSAWNDHGIHSEFKSRYGNVDNPDAPSLHYEVTSSDQPVPFAVFSLGKIKIEGRMTGDTAATRNEIHSYPLRFTIYAEQQNIIDENGTFQGFKSAKAILAELAKIVIEKFGGHPHGAPPVQLQLDDACFLYLQYDSEFYFSPVIKDGLGGSNKALTIDYRILIDAPMLI